MLKSSRSLSMREARYLINSKVMPAVLYPAQVAIFPKSFLESVDKQIRAVYAKVAGVSINDVPVEYYYVGVESGGYGLSSFEQSSYVQCARCWMRTPRKPHHCMPRKVADSAAMLHK